MDEWDSLVVEMQDACKDLYGRDTKVVVGRGGRHPRVVFIGEAPGAEEDKLGVPFVGRSGAILEDWIRYLELGSQEYYITNVVRCRPPNNRNPTADEVALCSPFLGQQLALLDPEVIVCMGRFAMQYFYPKKTAILKESGRLHDGKYYVVPHPSYFLRRGGTGWQPFFESLRRHLQGKGPVEKQSKLV